MDFDFFPNNIPTIHTFVFRVFSFRIIDVELEGTHYDH